MEHDAAPTWKPDEALTRVLDAAKARAILEGQTVLTAKDIAMAIDDGESHGWSGPPTGGTVGPIPLDDSARRLLRANGEDGTVTAADVRARLMRGRRRPQPFDTVEEWLMAELRAWRLMAAAAEVQYGSAAFCPPGERRADPERAEAMRAEARRQIEAIGERLTVTDWHPRRNPLARLMAEYGLSGVASKYLFLLYLHDAFGIWSARGAPAHPGDVARTLVETVGETDLVDAASRQLQELGLVAAIGAGPGEAERVPAETCLQVFRDAVAADFPSWWLRSGSRGRWAP